MFVPDNTHDIAMQFLLPYLPWRRNTDRIISVFCLATQGGQGKYNSDCYVSLSMALLR
jgi:hypothetical protein